MEVFKASEDDVEGSKVWLLPRLVSRAIVGLGKRIKWSDFRGEAASNLHPPPFFHKISIFPPILPRNRFKSTGAWHTNGKQLVFDYVFSLLKKPNDHSDHDDNRFKLTGLGKCVDELCDDRYSLQPSFPDPLQNYDTHSTFPFLKRFSFVTTSLYWWWWIGDAFGGISLMWTDTPRRLPWLIQSCTLG